MRTDIASALTTRIPAARPFAVIGGLAIVAGGLVAAVTSAAPSEHGAWAAAYLVLVVGVAQVGLGVGQALLAPTPPTRRLVLVECLMWNGGSAAVLTGTVLDRVRLVDAGGVVLALALAALWWGVRGPGHRKGSASGWAAGWAWWAYRGVIVVVLVSIPVGLALARLGAG